MKYSLITENKDDSLNKNVFIKLTLDLFISLEQKELLWISREYLKLFAKGNF